MAVNVLPPEVARGVNTDRFDREIDLLGKLRHPYIVPTLTAGEVGGIPYHTMLINAGPSRLGLTSR